MDGLNDPSLDREIESLFAVGPSPEFVARVRARVAEEPEPRRWHVSWMLAMAGAVAAVVVVSVLTWPSHEPISESRPGPAPQITRAAETLTAPSPSIASLPVPKQVTARRPLALAVAADRAIEIDFPKVVIAENEARTFASLVTSVRQSRFDVAVPSAPDPDRPLEIKELPPVEPLEIEPIVRVAVLQTEGERP